MISHLKSGSVMTVFCAANAWAQINWTGGSLNARDFEQPAEVSQTLTPGNVADSILLDGPEFDGSLDVTTTFNGATLDASIQIVPFNSTVNSGYVLFRDAFTVSADTPFSVLASLNWTINEAGLTSRAIKTIFIIEDVTTLPSTVLQGETQLLLNPSESDSVVDAPLLSGTLLAGRSYIAEARVFTEPEAGDSNADFAFGGANLVFAIPEPATGLLFGLALLSLTRRIRT